MPFAGVLRESFIVKIDRIGLLRCRSISEASQWNLQQERP